MLRGLEVWRFEGKKEVIVRFMMRAEQRITAQVLTPEPPQQLNTHPKSEVWTKIQGMRGGRFVRTNSGLMLGRDKDLETQATSTKIKGQQAGDKVLISLKQRAAKMLLSGIFFFPCLGQAEQLRTSPTPRDQNRKCRNGHMFREAL